MTRAERRAVRTALLGLGFQQVDIGYDGKGDGAYTEVWSKDGHEDTITLAWAPRAIEVSP